MLPYCSKQSAITLRLMIINIAFCHQPSYYPDKFVCHELGTHSFQAFLLLQYLLVMNSLSQLFRHS